MSEKTQILILNTSLALLFCIGFALSVYSYYVEYKLEEHDNYTAVCDINEHVSCSKVFKSPYAKGMGIFPEGSIFHIPNSIYGIAFYNLMIILSYSSSEMISHFLFGNVVLSNCTTPYFAYLLYFVLHDLCVVCISIYIVNALSLFLAYKKMKLLNCIGEKKARSKIKSH